MRVVSPFEIAGYERTSGCATSFVASVRWQTTDVQVRVCELVWNLVEFLPTSVIPLVLLENDEAVVFTRFHYRSDSSYSSSHSVLHICSQSVL